ncbi:hypothetical protein SLEP1_g54912 [Rubroshorea leprosula]|uniref:Uncharacterized protein n=1 Tax=Rubroshorea leprosula TaxID=152421 RepID=A0AAV5ME14_9ROSI|nr:hypothetical protein SLEP1_g54912 [Rubroshorea leprosula]
MREEFGIEEAVEVWWGSISELGLVVLVYSWRRDGVGDWGGCFPPFPRKKDGFFWVWVEIQIWMFSGEDWIGMAHGTGSVRIWKRQSTMTGVD